MAMKYPEDRVRPYWMCSDEGVVYSGLIGLEKWDPATMFDTQAEAVLYADENGIEIVQVASNPEMPGSDEAATESAGDAGTTKPGPPASIESTFAELTTEDFTSEGYPRVAKVQELLGYEVSAGQIQAAWDEYDPDAE